MLSPSPTIFRLLPLSLSDRTLQILIPLRKRYICTIGKQNNPFQLFLLFKIQQRIQICCYCLPPKQQEKGNITKKKDEYLSIRPKSETNNSGPQPYQRGYSASADSWCALSDDVTKVESKQQEHA
jgi:hypothetical protein